MMAAMLARSQTPPAMVLFANTGMETAQTYDFIDAVDRRILSPAGCPVVWLQFACDFNSEGKSTNRHPVIVDYESAARKGEPFFDFVRASKMLPSRRFRTCTETLKIDMMNKYSKPHFGYDDAEKAIGLRFDEPRRVARVRDRNDAQEKLRKRNDWHSIMPLAEWRKTRACVIDFWRKEGNLGLPFNLADDSVHLSNCEGCFYGRLGEQLRVAVENPARAAEWAKMERFVTDYRQGRPDLQRRKLPAQRVKWIEKNLNRLPNNADKTAMTFNNDWRWDNVIELAAQGGGGTLGLSPADFSAGGCADGECGVDL